MSVAVGAKNLVKDFGSVIALDGLNFKIEKGEIFGLIGLNGAGKTTALRITATLLLPTSGTVTVFGHDVIEEASEVRNLISYLPEEAGAYKNLSGLEYLRFMASFRVDDKDAVNALVDTETYDKRLRPNYGGNSCLLNGRSRVQILISANPVLVGVSIHVSSISAVSEVQMVRFILATSLDGFSLL